MISEILTSNEGVTKMYKVISTYEQSFWYLRHISHRVKARWLKWRAKLSLIIVFPLDYKVMSNFVFTQENNFVRPLYGVSNF